MCLSDMAALFIDIPTQLDFFDFGNFGHSNYS